MARTDQVVAQAPRRPWLLRHITGAVAIECVLLLVVLAVLWGNPIGWAVAGVLAIIALVLALPMNGRTVWHRLRLRSDFSSRRGNAAVPADIPFDLVPLAQWVPNLGISQTASSQGDDLGVVTDGDAWTAVLALSSDDDLMADSYSEIDLDSLDGLTRQDDVVFAGVQVVTYSVPCPTEVLLGPDSLAARAYLEIAAVVPPPTIRKTWLCVRLDPRLCLEAVARRGSGTDGIHATLRFGLHRVQTALKRQGIETRALNALEVSEVLALCSGAGPEHAEPRSGEQWAAWHCDGMVHTGCPVRTFGPSSSVGYQELLAAVSSAPVLFALTSFTLSPIHGATGALRVAAPTEAEAHAALGQVTQKLSGKVKLSPPGGMQVPTVLGTVPLGVEVAA